MNPVPEHCLAHGGWAAKEVCVACRVVAHAAATIVGRRNGPGRKDDDGKAPWHLVPWRELSSVVDVIAYGAKKYGEWNWQGVELSRDRYFAALSRHLVAWRMGERVDPESGLPHLAHVACNALFLAWHDRREETSR